MVTSSGTARLLAGLILAGAVLGTARPPSPPGQTPLPPIPKAPRPALRTPTIILRPNGSLETRECREQRTRLRWSTLRCGPWNQPHGGNRQ